MTDPTPARYGADFWNDRFSAPGYIYGTEPNDYLASIAAHIPPGPVLCLAEGEGRNAVHLAGLGHAVTAVDLSAVGLAKARQLAATRGLMLTTQAADLTGYAIAPGAWAGIVAIFMHLPPGLRRAVLARAVTGLQPGGVFILEAYTPAQVGRDTGGPQNPALCPTLAALRTELAGLDFVVGRELERDVREGDGHTGRAAVVQVLARKPAG